MGGGGMDPKDVFSLGLGLNEPWKLAGHRLDVEKRPHELHLEVVADRGALFPCPDCKRACKAHDFESFTWRHLNFFQHHCFITARVPRIDCPDHGVKRVTVPWARAGSRFTLLFEQAAVILAREMPVAAAARFVGITDKRLWRVLQHYVARAVGALDLGSVRAVGLDETASKRGHNYVTVFIDMDRADKPVIFATPGKGKACVAAFRAFLLSHRGEPTRVAEVVCDMSPAFLAALATSFPKAAVTVDWFHVVQIFTTAVDQVRKAEARSRQLPKAIRWAVLRAGDGALTDDQRIALAELETGGFATAAPYRDARSRSPRARHRCHSHRAHHPALEVIPLQRPSRRLERHLPGRTSPRPRIPKHRHLYHHHLPARGATPGYPQIHLKRRGAHDFHPLLCL